MELHIRDVSKTYSNGVQALKNVTLTIPVGMYGLLGPNGSGKSTLMRTIATLQEPDEGAIRLGDIDVLNQKDEVRRTLGYLPQEFGVYPKVSAESLLDHFAILKGIAARPARQEVVEALLRQTNLWEVRKQKLGGYSGGMRQRFGVAVALLGNPKLMIVDEPTAGLDPAERVRFLNLLSELGENSVVLLSTHIVEDVSELCTRMAIIDRGEILLEAEPLRAVDNIRGRIWRRVISKEELPALERKHAVISTKLLTGRTVVYIFSDTTPGPGFESAEPDLEDVYFSTIAGHIGRRREQPEPGGSAMKFREIFRFEFAYQLRRAWPWLFFAVLIVLDFLMTRDGSLAEVLYADFFLNSPFAVAKTTVFGSLIWLLMAAAVAGEAAARDVATGMYPLTYTAPVSKIHYLGGRFLAALVLNALILLAVQAGILLAVYAPGVDAALIGPFRPAAFLTAYAFIALPNAFVATAIQFSLAARSGRAMSSYLGSLLLFFMAFFVASFLLFNRGLGTLLDPIGIRFIVEDLSRLWTTIEKSWRLIALEGAVLRNRLLWLGVALGVLAVTCLRFRFAHRTESTWWRPGTGRRGTHSSMLAGVGVTAGTRISVPQVSRTFGFALHARQILAIAWTSFRTIAKSWAGLALLAAIPLLTVLVVLDQMVSNGVPLVPTTAYVIRELTAPLSAELSRWVIIPLLIVFFAGELVWREREAGLSEIADAMPGSESAAFLGKFLGLGLVLVVFMALLTTAGMLAQAMLGYRNFESGLYLKILFGLQLPEYLLFAVLAFVVHVLVDQKYIGHLAAIIAYVFIALAPMFGIEHNLLIYGAGPGWSYTEMRGFGAALRPWLWFKLYWAAWALLLAVVARLLWVRGRERGVGVRLQLARRRLTRPTACTAGAALGLIFALGGFIFYNTNVLNKYLTASDIVARRAEYERRYGRYDGIPQPRLTGTSLHVEIYPKRRQVEIRGAYRLVNSSAMAIDSIHVATVPGVETGAVAFDRTASLLVIDEERGYRIYALERPLQPGDSLRLDFEVHIEPHGFRESGVDASVDANGSYFTNGDWLPAIGYQRAHELTNAADRRAQGLVPRPLIPSLYDVEARKERGAVVAFEAVVGTDADQVAVAPGALRRTWTEGGRRYFRYSTDAPIGGEWAFFSAEYAVREARWNDVAIRIFHDPRHTRNLDRMVRSIRASLDYYTRQFGPYRYSHISVVERPGDGTGMHADASMLTYTEGVSLWNPTDDPGSLDLPFAVVAHEMAHQWTVPYASVEGAPVMSESLAWYYAMKVVENARGLEHLRRLLNFMRQPYPYPPIRRGEPLLRGLDPYLAYRKGPFALYALSEYIGEERVNGALRSLLEKHRSGEPPLATTLDLYRELQAVTPDSLQYLLHDLFEVNTFWQLETERVTAEQTEAGAWQVTLDVRARKVVADGAGVETEAPMDEWVEIGVFAPVEEGGELSEPLYAQKHRIRAGEQTITVTAPRKPVRAGIDPYHLLDWEERGDDDNIETVEIKR